MLDVITGGRLISGFSCAAWARNISPSAPTRSYSLERHQEAHDLVVQPGPARPVRLRGQALSLRIRERLAAAYSSRTADLVPSMGSVETLEWAAHSRRKYVYLQAYSPVEAVARLSQSLSRAGAASLRLRGGLRPHRLVGFPSMWGDRRAGGERGARAHRGAVHIFLPSNPS